MEQITSQSDTRKGAAVLEAGVLLLAVVVLAIAALKFRAAIHVFGGAFMLLSAAALTASAIDRLTNAKHLQARLIITAAALAIAVSFVLAGR